MSCHKKFSRFDIYWLQTDRLVVYLSICLSFYLFIFLSVYLSICLSFYLFIFLSVYLSICLSFFLLIFLSVYLSIYLSFYLIIYLSVYLSICLSIYLWSYLEDYSNVHFKEEQLTLWTWVQNKPNFKQKLDKWKPSLYSTEFISQCYFHIQGTIPHLITETKGTDRLCKVVELSMQCCGKLLSDSFETYKTF